VHRAERNLLRNAKVDELEARADEEKVGGLEVGVHEVRAHVDELHRLEHLHPVCADLRLRQRPEGEMLGEVLIADFDELRRGGMQQGGRRRGREGGEASAGGAAPLLQRKSRD
jgi:hypothetical protein